MVNKVLQWADFDSAQFPTLLMLLLRRYEFHSANETNIGLALHVPRPVLGLLARTHGHVSNLKKRVIFFGTFSFWIFRFLGGHRGLCPYIGKISPFGFDFGPEEDRPSLCGNLCTSDVQCERYEKCCPTTCGYICHRAIHLVD
ncbi:uncharacterized protein LOC112127434 isoform X2 [Cimex lectularius]|uniref:WAP domain-containing protein n=1 Tax=Cimex lectularius TaxID=79782 RepID=A0A8I6TKQ6_CIMLE|nr:uncharacterized protein LOC112127434 isoform X2 [Cimex lectularius]